MVKQNKYKVIVNVEVPLPSLTEVGREEEGQDTVEKHFSTRQEVCEYLDILPSTLYNLVNNSTKKKASHLHKLKNVRVEKLPVYYKGKENPDDKKKKEEDIKKYLTALI